MGIGVVFGLIGFALRQVAPATDVAVKDDNALAAV